MKMWRKNFLAAAVALSAMTGHVYAAETAHTGTGDDELLPSYSLGEVVVTATRTQKRDIDVPAATTVITAKEIKDSGAANASDVLSKVDGFVYKSFGPNGASMGAMTNEVNVRGLKGGALVLMNGNPIAWRGKYNLDQIPASEIERIEIVKGGASVLYGSEAMSGVVNIITKKKHANEVHAGFGNYGQRSYGVSVGDERFGFYYNYDKFGRRDGVSYTEYAQARFHGQTRTDVYDILKQNMGVTYHVNPRLDFQMGYYETEGKYKRTVLPPWTIRMPPRVPSISTSECRTISVNMKRSSILRSSTTAIQTGRGAFSSIPERWNLWDRATFTAEQGQRHRMANITHVKRIRRTALICSGHGG